MTQNIFKPGDRIALPYLPILRIENDVAILKKTRPAIGDGCGLRHQVRVETPFYIRGGFRTQKKTMYKVPGDAFRVTFKTPYGTFVTEEVPPRSKYLDDEPTREFVEKLVREMFGSKVAEIINIEIREPVKTVDVYVRKFRHVEVLIPPDDYFIHFRKSFEGDVYFIYEFVSPDEAKLVDDVSRVDYVLLLFSNALESRAACATIKLLGGDVVWSDFKQTCCANRSNAVGMAVARHGGRLVVAYNRAPYRGCCESWVTEEWEVAVPPKLVNRYETSEPVATDLRPDEVV